MWHSYEAVAGMGLQMLGLLVTRLESMQSVARWSIRFVQAKWTYLKITKQKFLLIRKICARSLSGWFSGKE